MGASSQCGRDLRRISRPIMLLLLLVLAAVADGVSARAQIDLPQRPFLLKDLNPTALPLDASPILLTVVGDHTFFFASDQQHGFGLWLTDGTAEGTSFISNFGQRYEGWEVTAASAIGPYLIFVFNDGIHGNELWRSDGTSVGTALVRDLNPGSGNAIATGAVDGGIITTGHQVFFIAQDGVHGWGLWASDGTAAGTVMLCETLPDSGASGFPLVEMIAVGDQLYFDGVDAAHGSELWVSDGTPAGTHLVRDINPGPAIGNPYAFGAVGETLLLTIDDGAHGYELWRSDGTESGTRMVADINPGLESSLGRGYVTVGSQIFFLAEDGLHGLQVWQSDGTAARTAMVPRPPDDSAPLHDYTLLHTGAGCVFVEEHNYPTTRLLASCDGAEMTSLPITGYGSSTPYVFASVQNRVVFSLQDSTSEDGLWVTDGTAAGTARIAQVSRIPALTSFGAHVLFAAADQMHGQELWVSDGTTVGTRLVKDLNMAATGSGASCMYPHDGQLFFSADDGVHGYELWLSDGTPDGTRMLTDLNAGAPDSFPCDFTLFGETLVFRANGKLWRTDGTGEGTKPITTTDQPDGVAAQTGLTVVGDQGFFTTGPQNSDLWVLDANLDSAHLVSAFRLTGRYGPQPLAPRYAIGHHLVFGVWEYYGPQQLWTSDGTPEGTRMIAQNAAYLDSLGSQVLFIRLGYGEGDNALWATDGTVEGTIRLTDPITQYTWNYGYVSDSAAGRLFFAESLSDGEGWIAVSDGTTAGTRVLRQLARRVDSLAATDDGAFFVQSEVGPQGMMHAELWHTDGTSDGTALVRFFESPNWNVRPEQLTFIENRLLFVKGDEEHGAELWLSDGSPEGTRLCRDLSPGPRSSAPRLHGGAAVLGKNLILAADDGVHGEELWSLPLSTLCGTTLFLPSVTSS